MAQSTASNGNDEEVANLQNSAKNEIARPPPRPRSGDELVLLLPCQMVRVQWLLCLLLSRTVWKRTNAWLHKRRMR